MRLFFIAFANEVVVKGLRLFLVDSDVLELNGVFLAFLLDRQTIGEGIHIFKHLRTIAEHKPVVIKQSRLHLLLFLSLFRLVEEVRLGFVVINEGLWIAVLQLVVCDVHGLGVFTDLNLEHQAVKITLFAVTYL